MEMVYRVIYVDEDGNEQCIDTMTIDALDNLRQSHNCSWVDEDGNEQSD